MAYAGTSIMRFHTYCATTTRIWSGRTKSGTGDVCLQFNNLRVVGQYNCQDDGIPMHSHVHRRLQVRVDGHRFAVHAVADMLRSVSLALSKIFVFATQC